MASGQTKIVGAIVPKKSAVSGKIPSGATLGEIFSNLPDRKLWGYDGSNIFEYGSLSYFGLTGGTISGDTKIIGNLSANTFISGSTDLYDIFLTVNDGNDITRVQPGANIITGGTGNSPIISLVTSPSINGLTASGSTSLQALSATTIYSGNNRLDNIFLSTATTFTNTSVSNGINTYTGGVASLVSINISALTIDTIVVSGFSQLNTVTSTTLSGGTISGGTFISGGTNLYNIFSTTDTNDITRVQSGTNIQTGGTDNFPSISLIASPSINGLTASGNTSLQVLSATTIISGSTNLYSIFQTIGSAVNTTAVQPGSNIQTGGTLIAPIISLTASPSINGLTASGGTSLQTLSATTFVSGSTNLYSVFKDINAVSPQTGVVAGTNTYTGGTYFNPTINVSALTINTLAASGISQLNTVTSTTLSGGTISGGTFISGGTNLYNIFSTTDTNDITRIQPGANITTGGTGNFPSISLIASPSVNGFTASGNTSLQALSATTFISGTTDLYNIFSQGSGVLNSIPVWIDSKTLGISLISQGSSGVTVFGNVEIYGNIDIAGTASTFNTVTVQTKDNNIAMNLSGSHVSALYGGITVLSGRPDNSSSTLTIDSNGTWSANTGMYMSAITVNNGAIISGTTDLYSIFKDINAGSSQTGVNAGSNITTGGTYFNPIISLAASPSVNGLTASGSSQLASITSTTLSGGTISGGTFISGGTNLYNIFSTTDTNDITRVQPGSNIQTGGTGNSPIISLVISPSVNGFTASGSTSLQALSATTIISGSTNLYSIFKDINAVSPQTGVAVGTNTYTGGTYFNPTINVSALTINTLTASGSTSLQTVSGTTFISGSTNLYNIFSTTDTNDITRIQPGANITTGGTGNSPIISLVTSPSVNGFTASGSTWLRSTLVITGATTASTISNGSQTLGIENLNFTGNSLFANLTASTLFQSPIIYGGTNSASTLMIQSTSGAGVAGADIIFSNGSSEMVRMQAGSGPLNTSYTNPGGSGDRTSTIVISTNMTFAGPVSRLINGSYVNENWFAPAQALNGTQYIEFDFGIGALKVINEFKWYQNALQPQGTWKMQASNDNVSWSDIGTSFVLGTSTTYTNISSNASGFRYYRLLGISGTTDTTPYNTQEIEFKIGTPVTPNVVGIGVSASTAALTIKANEAGTYGQQILLSPGGTLATTLLAGSIEAVTDDIYFTITTGTARKKFILDDGNSLVLGRIPFASTNGRMIDSTGMTFSDSLGLNLSKGLTAATFSNGVQALGGEKINFTGTSIFSAITSGNFVVSGSSQLATATAIIFSGGTISGGTFISGGTNLYNIFQPIGANSVLSNGTNTYTAGTFYNQSVGVSALTINTLTASGVTSLQTVSGTTFISGSTNLYSIFQPTGANSVLGNGTNTYTGGTFYNQNINVSALTINTLTASGNTSLQVLSATTIISGSTNLYSVFKDINAISPQTGVAAGSNITTGGTYFNPIISLAASPSVNGLTASGATSLQTVSGVTFISGSTNLYSIFQTIGGGAGSTTAVQPGSNIQTGGTLTVPIISLVASPSFANFSSSGSSQLNTVTSTTLSGGTISGGTLFSGSTNVGTLLANSIDSAIYESMIYSFVLMGS